MTPPPNPAPPSPTDAEYKAATEHLWKTYEAINEWIRFADAKAGALLTINGVLIGAAISKIDNKQKFHPDQLFYWIALVLAVVCGAYLVASAKDSLLCIKPILKDKPGAFPPPKPSTIYFEHIAQNPTLNDFHKAVLAVKGDKLAFEEIAAQVYAVSEVARQKHLHISSSVESLKIGLRFGAALLIVLSYLTFVPGGQP
ncbi:hypothetical protein IAD21_01985 [Abditibacteriota bacterium]|nr:hypothetical protein IAD21_01985 [Abditibacteriota bacterium]